MSDAKILIVEDEGIEALDIQHRLINLGYRVPAIVFSGEEAIKKTEEMQPDLVLMDIMLRGGIDGVTAAEQIRARFDIPIVYLTAYADEDTLQRAKITAPYGYLVKPFKERELHITIDVALYKHKMEKRLKESEKWLATTLRSIGDAVIATDKEGQVTFMNPVAEDLTGWKLEEATSKKLTEIFRIINRDTRRVVENPVSKVLSEGVTVGLANHTVLIARNGAEIPIDDSAAPIRDDRGNMMGVILVFRDITEREKAEKALNDQREWLRVTLTSIGDAVITTDTAGMVTFVNPVAVALTGWQSAEAEGRPVKDVFRIVNEQTSQPAEDVVQRVLREGSIVNLANNTALITRQGRMTPIEDSAAPIKDTDGAVRGVVLVFHDVTEKRRAQAALRKAHDELEGRVEERTRELRESNAALEAEIFDRKKAEEALRRAHDELEQRVRERTSELEEANKELEGFAYSVSHDLRAPLRAIDGFSDIIQKDSASSFDEETRRMFDVIRANAKKMGRLIDDLLAFSRAGRAAMNLSTIDMRGLVQEVLEQEEAANREYSFHVQLGELPPAYGDRTLVRQVLANLMENAIKFTRDKPDPRIEVGSYETGGGEWVYYVKDNGVGFDMKYYDKLFGVFQRLVTDRQFEGTGVGLAIVHRLVSRHGGRVWAEGKLREGATFYFTLPRRGANS